MNTRGSGGRADTDRELQVKCNELAGQLEGNCALMLMELGQSVDAKHMIKMALRYDPTSHRLKERHPKILAKIEELGLQDFLQLNDDGNTLAKQGDFAGSLELHKRAHFHAPRDDKRSRSIILNNIANRLCAMEDWPQALEAAITVTVMDETHGPAWGTRSSIHFILEQWTGVVTSNEMLLQHGKLPAEDEDGARGNLQIAKAKLAEQQAKTATDTAAATLAEEQAAAEAEADAEAEAAKRRALKEAAEQAERHAPKPSRRSGWPSLSCPRPQSAWSTEVPGPRGAPAASTKRARSWTRCRTTASALASVRTAGRGTARSARATRVSVENVHRRGRVSTSCRHPVARWTTPCWQS